MVPWGRVLAAQDLHALTVSEPLFTLGHGRATTDVDAAGRREPQHAEEMQRRTDSSTSSPPTPPRSLHPRDAEPGEEERHSVEDPDVMSCRAVAHLGCALTAGCDDAHDATKDTNHKHPEAKPDGLRTPPEGSSIALLPN